eukprot:13086054-Alexandrium_andersonii.AAC.1
MVVGFPQGASSDIQACSLGSVGGDGPGSLLSANPTATPGFLLMNRRAVGGSPLGRHGKAEAAAAVVRVPSGSASA